MTRKISLAHLTVIELSPPEMVTVAHQAGYDAVDLRLCKAIPEDVEYPMFGDTPMLRETLRRLADTGLNVFDVEIIWIQESLRVKNFEPMFETAARLGAQRIKVGVKNSDDHFVTDSLSKICEYIAPFGLTADLEFMPFSRVRDLGQASRIVEQIVHSNANVLIDTLHFSRSMGKWKEIPSFNPNLFGYVQLCDAPAEIPPSIEAIAQEAREGRLFPGDGDLPLVEILRALPANLPVSLELPMKQLAALVNASERAKRAITAAQRIIDIADNSEETK